MIPETEAHQVNPAIFVWTILNFPSFFPDAIVLCLLLSWNLVSPSFRDTLQIKNYENLGCTFFSTSQNIFSLAFKKDIYLIDQPYEVIKLLPLLAFLSLLQKSLIWRLTHRIRDFQSGSKQGLKSLGGILHSLSLALSLLPFVVMSVMLGYKSVYLSPIPLIVTFAIIFLAKSVFDEEFNTWRLIHRAKHCLVASIFPTSSPRPARQEVIIFIYDHHQHKTMIPGLA